MAYIEVLEENGDQSRIMNVTAGVGPDWGMPEDVMLVKALLQIVLINMGYPATKLSSSHSGTLDKPTKENIKVFQQKFNTNAKSLGNPERLTVDGRVSRARGHVSWDKNHPWTIVKLNALASWYVRARGFRSAADAIVKFYPHIAKILKLDPADV